MSFNTPILYLMFNRPDLVKQTFPVIKARKPQFLYVAADGPRNNNKRDIQKCQECRDWVLSQIDWDCEVKTLFRDENLGCGLGPSRAITWFFENVEEGIILEDDCLPNLFFFEFAAKLLNTYRNDQRVSMISGFNICGEWKSNEQSYHFSYFGGVWGWATWKRSWAFFDFYIENWKKDHLSKPLLKNYFPPDQYETRDRFYNKIFEQAHSDKPHIWDSQWTFSRLVQNSLAIVPCKNLVKNIGFNSDASHTLDDSHPWSSIETSSAFELTHNNHFVRDIVFDSNYFSAPSKKSQLRRILHDIKDFLSPS